MEISKRTLLTAFGCILLVFYLVVSVSWSRFKASQQLCEGLEGDRVEVVDPDSTGFVTSRELSAEIAAFLGDIKGTPISQLNLHALSNHLNSIDKIESAEVTALNDNRIRVRVVPMHPLARIWTADGRSCYVNRQGKRISAGRRYHMDVPQIAAKTDSQTVATLLPLLDYLDANPTLSRVVTMINARDTNNIILIPAIQGHVINIGHGRNAASKFGRLERFYREVLPVKGWQYYDTISVKWDGQVVATRRAEKVRDFSVQIIDELENEGDDLATMATSEASDSTATEKPNKESNKKSE